MSEIEYVPEPRPISTRPTLSDYYPMWSDMYAHANGLYGWSDLRVYSGSELRGAIAALLRSMTPEEFEAFGKRFA